MDNLLKNNQKKIIQFLLKHEEFFINILEKFNNDFTKLPKGVDIKCYFDDKNNIDSLAAYLETGELYPIIKDKYIESVKSHINNNKINLFSIYGEYDTTLALLKQLNRPFRLKEYYYLMKLEKKNFKIDPVSLIKPNIDCCKCNELEFNMLKKLQYEYHLEEVYDNQSCYPYYAEMKSFKHLLKNKMNYALFLKNENEKIPVSKCYINRMGKSYCQLGGVYTVKKHRNNGYSKICVAHLIHDIFLNSDKKAVILFVKKNNSPAVHLYHKVGFEIINEMVLCYF